ncbi:conserved Plasmodium protein, unknown function [Plasmodium malariae]|uniref:Uncharacterized protein n=1 Tax=Plasmodium malariae TaxID=5858 RepID=A0A1A8W6C8_PLAMA|nr:conserved Plasmodium protein, unknown function [Plasmodium malariae]SBS88344.1 conserved Plasmodium protein, unknown function [Plasmodium malariae]SBT80265.1 conserved Plasmodium protein, unknown function [Plasmodium malariae]SCO93895.1 conserved Plasmodium protein, unknown function [Plasmodium malariae]
MDGNVETMKPYFPAVLQGCESVCDKFFKCLNKNLQPYGNENSARNGINQCHPLKINYEKCTEEKLKNMKKNSLMFLTSYKDGCEKRK